MQLRIHGVFMSDPVNVMDKTPEVFMHLQLSVFLQQELQREQSISVTQRFILNDANNKLLTNLDS